MQKINSCLYNEYYMGSLNGIKNGHWKGYKGIPDTPNLEKISLASHFTRTRKNYKN
jgi:hypothetical protein